MRRLFIMGLPFILATYCSQPTKEKIDLSKARASLRLADGSTISRDSSEEYSPYLVKMDDGHLVLVFGSNRTDCGSCSGHNLFFARSLTVFDGLNLPFFATPSVLNVSVTPMNAGGQINFAVKKNGTGIRVYVNLATASDFIRYADVTNVSSPTVSGWTNITNTNHESNSIIGISADGNKLYSTDISGIGYAFDPGNANAASPFGIGMDNATSAAPVRQENAGYEDALFGVSYGSTYAAAGAQYFGPIFEFDISLAANGLAISKMSTFVADNAADDLLLFSAFDFFGGGTEDLYVVTSHTSQGLWEIAGFVGFDFALPAAPPADHWYDMFAPATSCPDVGIGMTPWSATCTNITDSPTGSYNGTEAGEFGGTAYMTIAGQDVGNFFSISAWVNITSVSACATSCVIVANSALGAIANGFRLYVNGSGAVVLESGNGAASTSISTNTGLITNLTWNHVTISVDRMSGFATLYVNGFEEGTSNTIRTDFATAADLSFGAPVGGANPLTGLMDEIKIFSFPVDATIAELLYYE